MLPSQHPTRTDLTDWLDARRDADYRVGDRWAYAILAVLAVGLCAWWFRHQLMEVLGR